MRKLMVAAMMLAAVSLSVNAAKKDKTEPAEPVLGIKSGVITMANNMGQFQGMGGGAGFGGGAGMGGFGGGAGMGGGQRPQGQGGQGGQRQMNFDPSQMVTKIYFDDYGKKTVTVTSRGEAGTTRSLAIGEDNYQINDAEKSATKMPSFGGRRGGQGGGGGRGMGMMMGGMGGASTTPMFDWENLDAKTIKKNKIKELGEEEVAGVMCKMYSVTQSNQGYSTQMTVWVYKNLTMKSETFSDYGTMTQSVEKLEETDVDQSLFELPADYKVEEMQMNFGGGGMGGFGGGMGGGDFGGGMGGGGFGGGMGGGFGGGF
ncbi:MAG: hypothetical protein MJY68_07580 [Bacteroidaceae bacterium]|nr:hypothetical protein [Bacteroidaceae bacterium]